LPRITFFQSRKFFLQPLPIEVEYCALRLILCRGRYLALDRQIGEERLYLGRSQLCRMALAMKQDEAFNPVRVSLLGANALVLNAELYANLIEQFGRLRRGVFGFYF
jgi:hypothetical protein